MLVLRVVDLPSLQVLSRPAETGDVIESFAFAATYNRDSDPNTLKFGIRGVDPGRRRSIGPLQEMSPLGAEGNRSFCANRCWLTFC